LGEKWGYVRIYIGNTASADADLKEIDKGVFFSIFSLRFASGKRLNTRVEFVLRHPVKSGKKALRPTWAMALD
jgi:hypothetical protein